MATDWADVVKRYENGAELPSMPGARTLKVTGADDDYIYVSHRLWQDKITGRTSRRPWRCSTREG